MINGTIANPIKKWISGLLNREEKIHSSHGNDPPPKQAGTVNRHEAEDPSMGMDHGDPWKTAALEDFKSWLEDMPASNNGYGPDVLPETCDLYTLLTEFTALRQEIKMQNREQHRTLKTLANIQSITDEYKGAYHLFQEKSRDLADLENRVRSGTEERTAACFFDVRDTLARGHRASLETVRQNSFFRPAPKGIDGICKGYEMAIRRFDNALAGMGIYPVETIGKPFDPDFMKAVETKKKPGTDRGTVLEDISGGFMKNNTVLRYARVVVAD